MKLFLKNRLFIFMLFIAPLAWATGDIHWTDVATIKESLKDTPPMAVGFDIDETILIASPAFYHVANEQCEGQMEICMQTDEFWQAVNGGLDTFSLPKRAGTDLVRMHLTRGDNVYFITARKPSKDEKTTEILRKLFDAPQLNPVIFTGFEKGKNLKVEPIKAHDIQIFYGDSDSDIEAAVINNIRGIRILRSNVTLEPFPPTVGKFGEEVVRDSDH